MDPRIQALIDAAGDETRARAARIAEAWRIYEGDRRRNFKDERDPDEIRLNLAGLIVDTGVDFLFGQNITLDTDADSEADERDTWLAEAWGDQMAVRLQTAATHGAVAGHALLRIAPTDDANPRLSPPRILPLDPACYTAIWDPADIETLLAQVVAWTGLNDSGKETAYRQVLVDEGGWWSITDQQSGATDSGRWTTTGETRWDHAWSPIVDCPNLLAPGRYYGRPDLTRDVLDTQEAVNDSLSSTRKKDRLQNRRILVGKGFDQAAEEALAEGDAILLPDGESDLQGIDPAGGTVRDSLELYRTVKAALHEISRVPEIAAGRLDNIGQLSGLALQILYGPLVRKTQTKRRTYGAMISETSARLLELAGFGLAEDHRVAVRWPEILPSDRESEARAANELQRAGVSKRTTLGELGYDAGDEATARDEEAREAQARMQAVFDRGLGDDPPWFPGVGGGE